jgi:L-amino acid N-acyltransferase YncA
LSIIIRACEERDIPAITAIYRREVNELTATFELDAPDEAEMQARRAAILKNGYPYLVAERDGVLLGYAYANLYRARPAYRFTTENSIYIAEGAQGTGIGTALVKALITECEARDFRQMVAVIGGSENVGSIRLHSKLGFEMIGVIKGSGWKFGRWIDTVLMQLELGSGANAPPQKP